MKSKITVPHGSTYQWRLALVAGLIGGLAEVVWVLFYSALTPLAAADVAREITATALPVFAQGGTAVSTGVAIHMLLSGALGLAFMFVVWPFLNKRDSAAVVEATVLLLVGIWCLNFLVVLPLLNPSFVTLMPHGITLVSKALFGVAMAVVVVGATRSVRAIPLPAQGIGNV